MEVAIRLGKVLSVNALVDSGNLGVDGGFVVAFLIGGWFCRGWLVGWWVLVCLMCGFRFSYLICVVYGFAIGLVLNRAVFYRNVDVNRNK